MKPDGELTVINPLFSRVSQEFNNILRVIRESKGNNKLKSEFLFSQGDIPEVIICDYQDGKYYTVYRSKSPNVASGIYLE